MTNPRQQAPPAAPSVIPVSHVTSLQALGALCALIAFAATYIIQPISALRDDVRAVSAKVETYDELVKRVDTHDTQIAQFQTQNLQESSDIQDLRAKQTAQESAIQQLNTQLVSIAGTLNDIKSRVDLWPTGSLSLAAKSP